MHRTLGGNKLAKKEDTFSWRCLSLALNLENSKIKIKNNFKFNKLILCNSNSFYLFIEF